MSAARRPGNPATAPDADADPQKNAAFFADHRTGLLFANYLGGLSDVLLLAFVIPLALWFARRGASRALAGAIAVTGAITAAIDLAGVGVLTTLAYLGDKQPDPGLARTLYDVGNVMRMSTANFPFAVLMVALGLATLETAVLARWFGWVGVALGAAVLAAPAIPLGSPVSLLIYVLVVIWIAVVAVAMYRDAPRALGMSESTARPADA